MKRPKKTKQQLPLPMWRDTLKQASTDAEGLSQAVQISWADAHSSDAWAEIDNSRLDVDDGAIVESIGFVLEVGEKYVLLASSIHWPHCFGRLHIPLGWIEHVTPLKIAIQLPTTEDE
jgi:hypothetical protein